MYNIMIEWRGTEGRLRAKGRYRIAALGESQGNAFAQSRTSADDSGNL